ncbi:ABC transporter permease [Corallococcus sp. H22C18031201]|nr:ABC transporter permease [Corallococcus sp. H22C18031201]
MRTALAIARKELTISFTTPWVYVVLAAMAALSSFFFVGLLETFQQVQDLAREQGWERLPPDSVVYRNLTDGVVVQLWGAVLIITLFVAPFLSMRLFAEEKRNKTFELLMTAPVRPLDIVLGKYLGGLGVMGATLGLTLAFPLLLTAFNQGEEGQALEWTTVLLGYGGLLLWGATCMAVGMVLSALTESQMVAAFLTFAVLLPWMLLRGLTRTFEEPLRSVVSYLSFDTQLEGLLQGVVDVRALVFFASVIVFSLLLTHRAVEAQRWM